MTYWRLNWIHHDGITGYADFKTLSTTVDTLISCVRLWNKSTQFWITLSDTSNPEYIPDLF